jgi:hypothetical protein
VLASLLDVVAAEGVACCHRGHTLCHNAGQGVCPQSSAEALGVCTPLAAHIIPPSAEQQQYVGHPSMPNTLADGIFSNFVWLDRSSCLLSPRLKQTIPKQQQGTEMEQVSSSGKLCIARQMSMTTWQHRNPTSRALPRNASHSMPRCMSH